MDQKSWLWKKRSTEKTLIIDKATNSSKKSEEEVTEVHKILTEKTYLEREIQMLNEKLSSAHADCVASDDIAKKQLKISEEAISGWEKAENELKSLKEKFQEVLQQKSASEERSNQLDAALKDCMQQLCYVRDEQDKRIQNVVSKSSKEAELVKALAVKEKTIKDLSNYKIHLDADLNALRYRLESTKKENARMKNEIHVLEKEFDIRNEERELNCRASDLTRRQHEESLKKIAKLETECQRLRLLLRKNLLGTTTLNKVKREIDLFEDKNQVENKEKNANHSRTSSTNFGIYSEGNNEKSTGIEFPLLASRSSQVEERLQEPLRGQNNAERCESSSLLMKNVVTSLSDMAESDDKSSCAGSWASALILELEHFKNGKQLKTPACKSMRISDIDLMYDFVEMEKLAESSTDVMNTSKDISSEAINGSNILNSRKLQPNVRETINKFLELLEGVNVKSRENGENPESSLGFTVRVFQWKSDELLAILQQFVQTCNDLINGLVNLEYFVREVALSLEWILNHCFSIQDVSSMKDAILSRFDWDECTVDSGWANCAAECSNLPVLGQDGECVNCESKDVIGNLCTEVEPLRQPEGVIKNDTGKCKMMKENIVTQVVETNDELRKACQRILDLENELEIKRNSYKQLEEACHDLQKQLKRMASKEVMGTERHMQKQLQSDWEITAASQKLAEFQETILNLGKQLKALASPHDAALFEKVCISTPSDSVIATSSTPLLDKMLPEDNPASGSFDENKKDLKIGNGESSFSTENSTKLIKRDGIKNESGRCEKATVSLDIVHCEKNGGRGFLKKIFWRPKKANGTKGTLLLLGCS